MPSLVHHEACAVRTDTGLKSVWCNAVVKVGIKYKHRSVVAQPGMLMLIKGANAPQVASWSSSTTVNTSAACNCDCSCICNSVASPLAKLGHT